MNLLLLLLLPALASCSITVSLQTFEDSTDALVQTYGNFTDTISDNEIFTFLLTEESLKRAAEEFSGVKHDNVFLHSSNIWNKVLTSKFGKWAGVKRIMMPNKSQILCVQTENVIVGKKDFDSRSTPRIDFTKIKHLVKTTFESKWLTDSFFDIKEPMTYLLKGAADISFSSPWEKNEERARNFLLEGVNPFLNSTILKKKQRVVATTTATKITLTVLVKYTAKLVGEAACTTVNTNEGRFIWKFGIKELLKVGHLPASVQSVQLITVSYHTNGKIVLMDKETKKTLAAVDTLLKAAPVVHDNNYHNSG